MLCRICSLRYGEVHRAELGGAGWAVGTGLDARHREGHCEEDLRCRIVHWEEGKTEPRVLQPNWRCRLWRRGGPYPHPQPVLAVPLQSSTSRILRHRDLQRVSACTPILSSRALGMNLNLNLKLHVDIDYPTSITHPLYVKIRNKLFTYEY